MGTDPTLAVLIRLSLPAMSSLFINATYNVVDSLFVGRYVGTAGLAAVGVIFPFFIFLISIAILIGTGGAALISRCLGAGARLSAQRFFGAAVLLIFAFGAAIALLFAPLTPFWVRVLGSESLYARQYFFIISLASPFVIGSLALNNIVYAEGRGSIGFFALAFSSVLNIFLDWLFISVFDLAVIGVALATFIAQIIGMLILLISFLRPSGALRLNIVSIAAALRALVRGIFARRGSGLRRRTAAGEIIRIGLPASTRTASVVLLGFFMNRQALLVGGEEGLAVVAVIFRVLGLIALPVFGINQAFLPIASYNYGAQKPERVKAIVVQTVGLTLIMCYGAVILVQIFAEPLASLFNPEPRFVSMAARGFRIVFLCSPLIIINLVSSGLHQAIGMPMRGLLVAVSRILFFMLPLIIILPSFLGIFGIWLALPIGELISAVFSSAMALPILLKLGREAEQKK